MVYHKEDKNYPQIKYATTIQGGSLVIFRLSYLQILMSIWIFQKKLQKYKRITVYMETGAWVRVNVW